MADSQQRIYPGKEAQVHPTNDGATDPKKVPPSGTYVVQFPKDQIYRVPPPPAYPGPNRKYGKPPKRCSPCCRCLAWTFGLLLALIVAVVIAAGVLYLVYKPRVPKYSVERVSIRRFNFTSDLHLESRFDVAIRARNPNKKISIYYQENSRLTVFYSGVELCKGGFGAFRQGTRNTTVLQTTLKGSNVRFSSRLKSNLRKQQTDGSVPLRIDVSVPVKIKVGSLKTPKFTVEVHCDLTLNKLSPNENARVKSNSCKGSFWHMFHSQRKFSFRRITWMFGIPALFI